jgi:hypothetical protein
MQLASVPSRAKELPKTTDVWESMGLDQHIRPQFVTLRKSLKAKIEELEELCNPYVEKGEFPPFFIQKIKELKINGCLTGTSLYGQIGTNFLEGFAVIS